MRKTLLLLAVLSIGCAASSAKEGLRESLRCGMSRDEVKLLMDRHGLSPVISGDQIRVDAPEGSFELRFDPNGQLAGGLVPSASAARAEELCPSQTPLPPEMTNPQ